MKQIPMLDLKLEYEYMKDEIDAAIRKCLDHQRWILGPEVKELEESIASYLTAKHCIGVSSGTDALVLALRAMAIKSRGEEYFNREDKIITTAWTFTATGDAILRSGATPLFVDIDPKTFNIDPDKIREALSSTSNIIGILPVHLYGQACNMDEIMQIAKDENLFVVEDVAQAFGGKWKDQMLGTIGDIGTYSFFPSKNLGGFGDGGMVSTDDDQLAEILTMLRKHGGKDKYNVDHIGYNARLDTLQAAILLAKLKYIDEFNSKRREIAESYNEVLKDCNNIITPVAAPNTYHVFHQYTIRIMDGTRDAVQAKLKEAGIGSMVYYPILLHNMKVFESRCEVVGTLEEAEKASKQVLSLPIEPLMNGIDINYICKQLLNV